ncbi:unnamed protein product, partial [marine sediment metagenome]
MKKIFNVFILLGILFSSHLNYIYLPFCGEEH